MGKLKIKKFSNKKIVIVVLILLIFAVIFTQTTGFFLFKTERKYGTIEEALKEAKTIKTRPDYLPQGVYQNLPPFPEDFYEMDTLVEYEQLSDLSILGEEYYKQPEFYPRWEEDGVPLTQNPEKGRYGKWGWGAYPADQGYSSLPGDEFTAITFFHTSWLIQSYQGMAMQAVFPANGNVNSIPVTQDPDKAKDYFDVTLTPEVFLLGPTFPIFDADWVQKVLVHVKIANNTPPGTYLIGVNPTAPPTDMRDKWLLQYKLKYSNAGATGVERPYFQILLEVREE